MTLCLCMIVKNEEKVIQRLFDSVYQIIDSYCICDTGSTDSTKEIIQNYFEEKNIPGKLFEEPFKNFGYNRTIAIQEAMKTDCTHVLLMDADMVLKISDKFCKDKLFDLPNDIFYLLQGTDTFFYKNVRIVRCNPDIKYIGVTHEYVSFPDSSRLCNIDKSVLFIQDIGDGGCKSDKCERDILLLSNDIKENPDNVRSWFYLANTYRDIDNIEKATECYLKRIELGGWWQEIYYSYYCLGKMYLKHGKIPDGIYYLMKAYEYDDTRFENLFQIIVHFRMNNQNKLCQFYYDIYQMRMNTLKGTKNFYEDLFCEKDIYMWKMDYEYTVFSYHVGTRNLDMIKVMRILNNSPEEWAINSLFQNLKFYNVYLEPEKRLIFTKKFCRNWKNKTFDNCTSSSMSIIDYDDSTYLLNRRIVSYYITKNGSYEMEHDKVVTWNNMLFIDKNTFELIDSFEDLDEPIQSNEHHINGLEDVRIFRSCEAPYPIYFLASEFFPDKNIQIVKGLYDVPNKCLTDSSCLNYSNSSCEKNWVHCPFPDKDLIIYKWFPLQIISLSSLTLFKEIKSPNVLKRARGSSNGYISGNEIWFVVHHVSYESPRVYFHSFVVLDKVTLEILRFTPLFKFSKHPIEYCLGLIIKDDDVIITLSEMDRSSVIQIYSKQKIESQMIIENDLII